MKNIILIITDTFRYDNLGQRAERPVRTPELDRFAGERATEIERFYMGSFPTIPHRTDVAAGVLGWPHYGWQPIDLSTPNHVAQLLRHAGARQAGKAESGYVSQLICDCPHLFNARFQHAFDAAYQQQGLGVCEELDQRSFDVRGVGTALAIRRRHTVHVEGVSGQENTVQFQDGARRGRRFCGQVHEYRVSRISV